MTRRDGSHPGGDPGGDPRATAGLVQRLGRLGMGLILASLGVVFAAVLFGYAAVRAAARHDPVTGAAMAVAPVTLPDGLWASSAILLLSSAVMQHGLRSIRRGRTAGLARALVVVAALTAAFLAVQAHALVEMLAEHRALLGHEVSLYGLLFVLVGLHAVHVLGGLVPLAVVTRRALCGAYGRHRHEAVSHLTQYWHFLDGVWLVMFATLLWLG